ncbi:hypothetical protein QJS83_08345 [Bdellovibrio sp. 22V]|uniref:hypothetical protein n=1 Tax=Bdellovibrio TaxID=958 RepID=UPI0025437D32|nr:hypothetical protein [Bdellovibrio sp. 22V]WII73886.1 hypothetical protein QJS83_08345 [Bdellovibrio sp. 22V]
MNHMWKSLLTMWICLLPLGVFAQDNFKCGEYEFKGVLRKMDEKVVLKLYEGSMSEAVLTLASDLEELASVYVDNPVTLKGRLYEPVKNYRGHVESLKTAAEIKELTSPDKPYTARFMRDDINRRVPDPLHPDMDSGMKLVKEGSCGGREPSANSKKPAKKK